MSKKGTSRKKSDTKKGKGSDQSVKSLLYRYFTSHPKKVLNAKQLIKKLKIDKSKDAVQNALDKLEKEQIVFNVSEDRYRLDRYHQKESSSDTVIQGTVDMTKSGSAFIITDDLEQDVFVPERHLKFALDKDVVKVALTKKGGERRPEGKVKEIVKRASNQFVGLLRTYKGHAIVHIDHRSSELDIYIENDNLNKAEDGEKVIVKLVEDGRDDKQVWGRVTTRLGDLSDNDLEMNSILINSGFNIAFPEEVIKESEAISTVISEEEIAKRRDIRDTLTFTIDPHDAKDFDDALSFEVIEDGQIRVGVHIADVTHYVRPGTQLDKEAYFRSTSVYLVDRVCPMLPEKLSNELCSLRPNEDKLCFSAIFTMDGNYKILNTWLGRTVIHSDHRFTYEGAQEVLESGAGKFRTELVHLNEIAKDLKKKRFRKGSINFETVEVKFKLDENAVPIGVYTKTRKDAHMLVEDFMLLANQAVAKFMTKLDKKNPVPAVYRVHDEPNTEKLSDLILFAKEMGIDLKIDTPKQIKASLNELAEKAQTDESLKMLQPMVIRSMSKAIYTTENIGHYGLAFTDYTHFTSPIRRYSDVLVHRLLAKNLENVSRESVEELEAKCKHISSQERKAMDAERASTKYKQVEYMKDKVGEVFEGFISGFIERGVFVELKESRAEGLITYDQLDDVYISTGSKLKVTGKKNGKTLSMGDPITVKLMDADMEKKRLEFSVEAMPEKEVQFEQ